MFCFCFSHCGLMTPRTSEAQRFPALPLCQGWLGHVISYPSTWVDGTATILIGVCPCGGQQCGDLGFHTVTFASVPLTKGTPSSKGREVQVYLCVCKEAKIFGEPLAALLTTNFLSLSLRVLS